MPNESKPLIARVVSNDRQIRVYDRLAVGKNPQIEIAITVLGHLGSVTVDRARHVCPAAEVKLVCEDILAGRDVAWTDGTINFLSVRRHALPYSVSIKKATGAFDPIQIRLSEHDGRLLALMIRDWIRAWEFNTFTGRQDAAMVVTHDADPDTSPAAPAAKEPPAGSYRTSGRTPGLLLAAGGDR